MVSKPVKALRTFYKDRDTMPPVAEMHDELLGLSDRASVVTWAALIEDALGRRIADSLPGKPHGEAFDEVFRFGGPLGSFSAKIEIAALFGVIGAAMAKHLTSLREMRNACAHSRRPISFKNQALRAVAKSLWEPDGDVQVQDDRQDSFQHAFFIQCTIFYQTLTLGSHHEALRQIGEIARQTGGLDP